MNMQNSDKKLWFKAKSYGWGWTPIAWQGWLVVIIYIIPIIIFVPQADKFANTSKDLFINFLIPFLINTIFLLIICYAKGEKPKWRWGNK